MVFYTDFYTSRFLSTQTVAIGGWVNRKLMMSRDLVFAVGMLRLNAVCTIINH